MYVVIVGNLLYGIQTVHGPFEDRRYADQWASVHCKNQHYYIFAIQSM